MKRSNYYKLQEGINRCAKFKGGKFQYALAKNMKKVQEEIESIEKAFEPSVEFLEFEKHKNQLLFDHCQKDATGQLVINQGTREITFESVEKRNAFQQKFDELKGRYQDAIEERDGQIREKMAFLDEESGPVEWQLIKAEDVPDDATGDLMLIAEFLE